MSPRRYHVDNAKGVLDVEWPLFGEMARALALKVAREYDPQIVVGIATSGVIPGAVVASIHNREFRAMTVTRRGEAEQVRETPHILGSVRSEEHTSELKSPCNLVCRLLLEKKKADDPLGG